jgi:uncharacterized membrane protein
MFEGLFKFSPINFAEGELGIQYGSPMLIVLLVVLLGGALGILYWLTNRYPSERAKATSFGLRAVVLILLCIPLLEPVLVSPDVVPDENFVAVLVDDSESMMLTDGEEGITRKEEARRIVSELAPELGDVFKIRYYTFSSDASRVDSIRAAAATGTQTNLSTALDRVLNDFQGLPLTGVVLLTDGADNSMAVPRNQAEIFREREIPLHVVGIGREDFENDRELLEVVSSRSVEETTGAELDVKVRSWAREPEPVTFNLYRGDQVVHTETRSLKGEGLIDQFTVFYEPGEPGAAQYTLEVATADEETNTANNRLNTLIDTKQDTIRVLYFEGHLRRDFKYIKRTLEDDEVITFTSVVRTGVGKYYRQGITRPDELAGGFPSSEEELFKYRAIVLGDIEASAFSPEQLAMIERFVRVRGGGVLMLGGRRSFADGDYWNTPVADLLPVELDPSRRTALPPDFSVEEESPQGQGFKFVPTSAGLENPILKLSPDAAANQSLWGEMPGLTSINYLGPVKPGALVLAEKPEDDFGAREPLLVIQRYGKGRSAALATASTWRWQMLSEASDARHERFWRQLVRWLVASTPGPVNIDESQNQFAARERATLTVTVYDGTYQPVNDAIVMGTLTDPYGGTRDVPFQQSLAEPGLYEASFVPQDQGLYQLSVVADRGEVALGNDLSNFLVRPAGREYYDATLKRPLLASLAQVSNGVYYEPDEAEDIPENLRGRRTSTSIYQAEMLWDMPFLFLLALILFSVEWIYRRRKGLP